MIELKYSLWKHGCNNEESYFQGIFNWRLNVYVKRRIFYSNIFCQNEDDIDSKTVNESWVASLLYKNTHAVKTVKELTTGIP